MVTVKYYSVLLIFCVLHMRKCGASANCEMFSTGDPQKKEFYSPNYPNFYLNNMYCTLHLTAPVGHVIRVEFHTFQLENYFNDYVEINEGNSSYQIVIGQYCGQTLPPVTTSEERELYLIFISDGSQTYSGFRASYQFVKVETGLLAIPGIQEARIRGIERLRQQRGVASEPHRSRMTFATRAVVALRLASAANSTGEEDMMSHLETAAALLHPPVSVNQLSFSINALLSTCHNPRFFFGKDLTLRLLSDVISTPNVTHPAAYLALCNAFQPWPMKAVNDLQQTLNSSSGHLFLTDIKAMAVLAVSCMANNSDSLNTSSHPELFADYEDTLQRFTDLQHRGDGSFGNVYTTALIVQALLASGMESDPRWNLTSSVQFLMRETNKTSVDILTTYLTLPIFSGKTLADINTINCSVQHTRIQEDIERMVREHAGPMMRVRYSLMLGDERDVTHYISLRVPANFTAPQLMRLAAVQNSLFKFEWWFSSGKMYVYQIANITNDPEMGLFWQAFLGSASNGDKLEPININLEQILMEDNSHFIMWYKTAHFT